MSRRTGRVPSDAVVPMGEPPIAFGTNGWRGVRGAAFTLGRVRLAARAVGRFLSETGAGREVVVARDTRAGGAEFLAAAVRELASEGLAVTVARGAVPTPAAVHALRTRGAAAAIVFTASHNPPEYSGMKVFGAWGGILPTVATRRIETLAAEFACTAEAPSPEGPHDGVDVVAPYIADLLALVDRSALAASGQRVVYDAMHGAGGGVLDRALAAAGVAVQTLHCTLDPGFGGGPPDPIASRLVGLCAAVRETAGPVLGIATDGDADRFAVVAPDGSCLGATEAVALLVDHLATTGRIERGIAISRATGSLVERVAAAHGLRVERHPIGFRFLSEALCAGAVDAAGEESGGFALGRFGCDKDGILAGLLFAEMLALDGAALDVRLAALRRRFGAAVCGRTALAFDPGALAALERLMAAPPTAVGGVRVEEATLGDGLHLALSDGFLMLRRSGTEPVLRLYAEAPSVELLERRFADGLALVSSC